MDETLDWGELRLFLAVSRAGGLAGAVPATGLSPPTLGRRMAALEARLGVRLFRRHRLGYAATAAGHALFVRALEVEAAVAGVERWRDETAGTAPLRISAGYWTSRLLAAHLDELGCPAGGLALLSTSARLDLRLREAEIGIRNARPTDPGLAGRRIGEVAFAAYAARGYVGAQPAALGEQRWSQCHWLLHDDAPTTIPSMRWAAARVTGPVRLRCSHPGPLIEAAAAGAGLCLLPCFVGDLDRRLMRVSATIPELRHERWMVLHDDDRHRPPVRALAGRVVALWRRHSAPARGAQDAGIDLERLAGLAGTSQGRNSTSAVASDGRRPA